MCPSARLRIVGHLAHSKEAAMAQSVERVGAVGDLAGEYGVAQVVVSPLLSGSAGVKIKVAEAMAYGRPLVTTSVGVDPGDSRQLDLGSIVANEPGDFANAVNALLLDEELRRKKREGAIRVFKNNFSFDASYGPFCNWLESVR